MVRMETPLPPEEVEDVEADLEGGGAGIPAAFAAEEEGEED